jgi:hypothetical protein
MNEVRFKGVLNDGERAGWVREGSGGKANPYRYRRFALVSPPGEDNGGKE